MTLGEFLPVHQSLLDPPRAHIALPPYHHSDSCRERGSKVSRAIECEEREDGGGSKVLRTRGWGGGGGGR